MTEESEDLTGPPIGDPPEHVHANTPVTDAIDDATEEVDELIAQVSALETISATRHTELLERIEQCRQRLNSLPNQQETESPILLQITSQLTQIQAEILSLKSSLDILQNRRQQNESRQKVTETATSEEQNPVVLTEEPSEESIENPVTEPTPKRRWV